MKVLKKIGYMLGYLGVKYKEPLLFCIFMLLIIGSMAGADLCWRAGQRNKLKSFDIAMGDPQGLEHVQVLITTTNGNKTSVVRLRGSAWCKVTTHNKLGEQLFDDTVKCNRVLQLRGQTRLYDQ